MFLGLVFWWLTMVTAVASVQQFHPTDFALQSGTSYGNPYTDVSVIGQFKGPNGESLTLKGFYNGNSTWVVRASFPTVGTWTYNITSSDPNLNSSGSVEVILNTDPAVHGGLKVQGKRFVWEDGTHFQFRGFEADWLFAPDFGTVQRLVNQAAAHGFNVITFNPYAHDTAWAGGHSSAWDFGPPIDSRYLWGGNNNSPNHSTLKFEAFQNLDDIMNYLLSKGIVAHIMIKVYNKSVNYPGQFSSDDDLWWDYLVRRYAAYPNVIWDTAKESFNTSPDYSRNRVTFLRDQDVFDRLITVHDPNNSGTDAVTDFVSDQVHSDHFADAISRWQTLDKPYVNIEYGYERGVENLPTYQVKQDWEEVVRRYWRITLGGGGHNYYYSNTSWDLFKPDPEPPGWDAHGFFTSLWEGLPYWRMIPSPHLIVSNPGGVYCLADIGNAYVILTDTSSSFLVELITPKPLTATWYDIYNGNSVSAGTFNSGTHQFQGQWGHVLVFDRDLQPTIEKVTVSPNPFIIGQYDAVYFEAIVPGSDINRVRGHIEDPNGQLLLAIDLDYISNGRYTASVEMIKNPKPGIWKFGVLAIDNTGNFSKVYPVQVEVK